MLGKCGIRTVGVVKEGVEYAISQRPCTKTPYIMRHLYMSKAHKTIHVCGLQFAASVKL
jgi:hypothetical protein